MRSLSLSLYLPLFLSRGESFSVYVPDAPFYDPSFDPLCLRCCAAESNIESPPSQLRRYCSRKRRCSCRGNYVNPLPRSRYISILLARFLPLPFFFSVFLPLYVSISLVFLSCCPSPFYLSTLVSKRYKHREIFSHAYTIKDSTYIVTIVPYCPRFAARHHVSSLESTGHLILPRIPSSSISSLQNTLLEMEGNDMASFRACQSQKRPYSTDRKRMSIDVNSASVDNSSSFSIFLLLFLHRFSFLSLVFFRFPTISRTKVSTCQGRGKFPEKSRILTKLRREFYFCITTILEFFQCS